MITVHELTVYLGHNNPQEKTIRDDSGNGLKFETLGTSKLSVFVGGVELSSNDGYLSFDDTGKVLFTLGSAIMPKGTYAARLVMYTPQFPLGYPIFSEKTDTQLHIEFV